MTSPVPLRPSGVAEVDAWTGIPAARRRAYGGDPSTAGEIQSNGDTREGEGDLDLI